MRKWFVALVLLVTATAAAAQTPTWKLVWNTADSVAAANGFSYTLKVDALSPVVVTPTCAGTPTVCTAPLPTLASGPHTLILTVFGGGTSTNSDPLTLTPPAKPTTISVTVTITIP